ncbi:hypothetical protein [Paracoccus sp. ME4]|uniref:hypothetical protein n=1 Tax=Paracoccus sp. ME4 TaxID=3138066 RepID=UPI00398AF984
MSYRIVPVAERHMRRRGFFPVIGGACIFPSGLLAGGEASSALPTTGSTWSGLEMTFGKHDAKVDILLWMNLSDVESAWRFDPLAALLFDRHVPAGNVRLTIRDICDGRQALWAALAARSGGPELYRQMASSLYMGVSDIGSRGGADELAAAIVQAVEHHGVPRSQIMRVMTDRDLSLRLSRAAGTAPDGAMPRAFVNGKDIGLAEPDVIDASIAELLEGGI